MINRNMNNKMGGNWVGKWSTPLAGQCHWHNTSLDWLEARGHKLAILHPPFLSMGAHHDPLREVLLLLRAAITIPCKKSLQLFWAAGHNTVKEVLILLPGCRSQYLEKDPYSCSELQVTTPWKRFLLRVVHSVSLWGKEGVICMKALHPNPKFVISVQKYRTKRNALCWRVSSDWNNADLKNRYSS